MRRTAFQKPKKKTNVKVRLAATTSPRGEKAETKINKLAPQIIDVYASFVWTKAVDLLSYCAMCVHTNSRCVCLCLRRCIVNGVRLLFFYPHHHDDHRFDRVAKSSSSEIGFIG